MVRADHQQQNARLWRPAGKAVFPDVAPFAAVGEQEPASLRSLAALATEAHRIALVTPSQLLAPAGLVTEMQAPLLQMVLEKPIPVPKLDIVPTLLGKTDVGAMLDLAARTRPGPFAERTPHSAATTG
ncbi:hypothetical protein [Rhizobium sp. CNPSo 4039]|uniref:hypothetical protein n=1 Tax=Rhizobium sp. CNPSo 4039 TaxID=3021409 RepID=UPI00254D744A|nr:hypothetical protein [Rhizobium sp. CNPSo 4039]MDK4717508.1 hypothetical protein [Rhizobium sp. CNPSo 4039]